MHADGRDVFASPLVSVCGDIYIAAWGARSASRMYRRLILLEISLLVCSFASSITHESNLDSEYLT